MPFFLLIALFLAFGFESPFQPGSLTRLEFRYRAGEALGGLILLASFAMLLGRWVAARVARGDRASSVIRRRFAWATRLLEIGMLVDYGWIIHQVGWPWIVRDGIGLRGWLLVDDALILLPYVLMQLSSWWALYPAERASRASPPSRSASGLGRYLTLKTRQSLGLVLPVVLVYALGQELVQRQFPAWASGPWAQPVEVAVLGSLVLMLSPLLVRVAWPTRSLQPGPLRERLERLTRRLGFPCTDILVWDTGFVLVNAGVTGSLPWFRYVLLTDALVEYLDDHEIAAVFSHEIGHIAHRHLLYFGLFFLGSLGVLALFDTAIERNLSAFAALLVSPGHPLLATAIQTSVALLCVAFYFLAIFGHVSRRFERQADVFGCQAVSCGQPDCPPHADLDGRPGYGPATATPCPVGIRIFANALSSVASLNGMEPKARSWRHGSIARRIAFLEGLAGKPDAVRRFHHSVWRLRLVVALALIAVLVLAFQIGFERF